MNMDTAAKTLNLQSHLKAAELEQMIYRDFSKPNKSWSNLPTAPHTVKFAEELIKVVEERSALYTAERVGERAFQVRFTGSDIEDDNKCSVEFENQDYDSYKDVPIPIFDRIREVVIDHDGVMHCSCRRFRCRGIFCEQHVCTAKLICQAQGVKFQGFTHHDIALRWRSDYMHLAYKDSTPAETQKMFHLLAMKDVAGPTFKGDIPDNLEISPRAPILPALDRLKNYSKEGIDLEKIDGMFSTTFTPSSQFSDESGMEVDRDVLDKIFEGMFNELQSITSSSSVEIFESALANAVLPQTAAKGVGARETLKSLANDSYALADKVGQDGVAKLEEMFNGYLAWCNTKLSGKEEEGEDMDTEGDLASGEGKRKYVPFTQDSYDGTAKRVLNTRHMP